MMPYAGMPVSGNKHHGHSKDAFIPLHFKPGEAYQFDWTHETVVVLGGITQTVKVVHVCLCSKRSI